MNSGKHDPRRREVRMHDRDCTAWPPNVIREKDPFYPYDDHAWRAERETGSARRDFQPRSPRMPRRFRL